MHAPTLANLNASNTAEAGLPKVDSVLIVKALIVLARMLDRDGGVTGTGFEAAILAVTTTTNPATTVP